MTTFAASFVLTLLSVGQAGQFDLRNDPRMDVQDPRVDPRVQPRNDNFNQPGAGPIVGGMEHFGWGLSGTKGRHYFFGGTAFADYVVDGRRYVVSMREEEDASLLPDREKFMYYREIGTGHRWAISKHAGRDGNYPIYFQVYQDPRNLPNGRGRWVAFHNARLIEDSRAHDERPRIPVGGMSDNRGAVDPRGFTRPSLRGEQYAQDYDAGPGRGWVYVPATSSDGCCGGW